MSYQINNTATVEFYDVTTGKVVRTEKLIPYSIFVEGNPQESRDTMRLYGDYHSWIPVTDRLPTEREFYAQGGVFCVTVEKRKDCRIIDNYVFDSNEQKWNLRSDREKVIAWRFREKPYLKDLQQ